MPVDWKQLLQLAPLALTKPGSPQGAALMAGFQHSMERIRREQERAQQLAGQDEFRQAQIQNLEADNARQDQQFELQKERLALERLASYGAQDQRQLGALAQAPEAMLDPTATPLSAQNDLTVQRLTQQQQLGVPAGTPQGPLPNMTVAVSTRDKRAAQQVLDRIEKNKLYADYLGKPELEELSVQMPSGETVKIRDLRQRAGGQLLGPGGEPAPLAPKIGGGALPGSFAEFVDAPPERRTRILADRKLYQQADDKAASGDGAEGWRLQAVSDPSTNETKLIRVHAGTGEVQPVTLPGGMQPGGARQARLSTSQQEDLSTMLTLEQIASKTIELGEQTRWSGVGGFKKGSFKQFTARNLGSGTMAEQSLRNNIGQILGTIAKLRGGTSFTPNEQKLLETYTPTIDDNPLMIKSKLNSLKEFIIDKRRNTLQFAGAGKAAVDSANDPMGLR